MTRTLCIANQCAGVGKTTTTINLATGLARAGLRCLVIDLDPRGAATQHLQPSAERFVANRTYVEGCYLAPGTASEEARSSDRIGENWERLTHKKRFDYVVLDCPPTAEATTAWALRVADELIMPLRCDEFGLDGVPGFVRTLKAAINAGSRVEFAGVLLTHRESTAAAADVEQEAREFFGDVLFDVVIPLVPELDEAKRAHRALMDVAPRSRGARAYLELCREVIER